jgi:hypothetical protein
MFWKLVSDLFSATPSTELADDALVGGRLNLSDADTVGGDTSPVIEDDEERRREQQRLAEEEEERREEKRLREEDEASTRRVNSIVAAYEIGRLDRRR